MPNVKTNDQRFPPRPASRGLPRYFPMKPQTLNYIFQVEYKSCAADNKWVERSGRWRYPNDSKASPYAIAGQIAATEMKVTEQGIRVTFVGLENPATAGIVTALSPFTLTLARNPSPTPTERPRLSNAIFS